MKKTSKLMVTGLCVLTLLAGCGTNGDSKDTGSTTPTTPTIPKESVTRTSLKVEKSEITFWNPDLPTWQPLYEKLEKEFEAIYPEIDVKVLNVPQAAYFEKLNTQFAAKNGPDVWVGWYPISEYDRGYIAPLDEFVTADKMDVNQFFQPVTDLRGKGSDGKRYALPRDISMTAVVYNKDVFDGANVPYPTEDWTIEEFRDVAKRLTDKDKKIFGTDMVNNKILPGSPLIWNLGGDMISEDGYDAKGFLDGAPMVKAMEWMRSIKEDGSNMPADIMETLPQTGDNPAFASGTVGMSRIELWGFNSLKDLKFKWGIVPFPKESKDSKTYGWVDTVNWHMNNDSKHKNEAWAWMSFLAGKQAAQVVAEDMSWMPAYPEVWVEKGWDKDENMGVFFAEGKKDSKISVRLRSSMYSEAINTPFKTAFTNAVDPLDGNAADAASELKKAAEEAQAIMDKNKK